MTGTGPSETPLLSAVGLSKVYADGAVKALTDVDLEIPRGQYLAIMGPSGSGKSTLLHLLGALDTPTQGQVQLRGENLQQAGNLDSIRAREFGFVFQSFYLLPNLTALENVQLPMFEGDRSAQERQQHAGQLLELVGVSHRAGQLPTRMSVGERQRVAIARALANDPHVLLADEPTGNLDTHTGDGILDLFAHLHRDQAMTIVLVTHELDVAQRANRLVRMRDGQIESDELIQPS